VHVGRWLKKLEQLTYGSWVAYDTALAGGPREGRVGSGDRIGRVGDAAVDR